MQVGKCSLLCSPLAHAFTWPLAQLEDSGWRHPSLRLRLTSAVGLAQAGSPLPGWAQAGICRRLGSGLGWLRLGLWLGLWPMAWLALAWLVMGVAWIAYLMTFYNMFSISLHIFQHNYYKLLRIPMEFL